MNINDFITSVTADITDKVQKNSVTPYIVGNAFTDLATIVSELTTNNIIIGSIDDGDGIQTNSQLNAAYPDAQVGQEVSGLSVMYQRNINNWIYYPFTNCL